MGGLLFAKKMREEGYITMLDPFQVGPGTLDFFLNFLNFGVLEFFGINFWTNF